MTTYLDTSAAAKLLVEEDESDALGLFLDQLGPEELLVSSALLETELRRVAVRLDLLQSAVSQVLARVALVEPQRSLFYEAGLLPGTGLRNLDALHLATALRLDSTSVVAYDRRFLEAARRLGLQTRSPTGWGSSES